MSIPVTNATILTGGIMASSITLTMCAESLIKHGFQFGLAKDKSRQQVLAMLCLLAGMNGIISYPFNQTKQSVLVSNVTTCIMFLLVQFGLVIVNHNSIIRIHATYLTAVSRTKIQKVCLLLYFLPWVVLTPIYFAIFDKIPQGQLINTSDYNSFYYKPLNIGLIIGTELIAVSTDVRVLYTFVKNISPNAKLKDVIPLNMLLFILLIWLSLIFDFAIKTLIALGQPLLFDSILSILTIALRARFNLHFGLLTKSLADDLDRNKLDFSEDLSKLKKQVPKNPPFTQNVENASAHYEVLAEIMPGCNQPTLLVEQSIHRNK